MLNGTRANYWAAQPLTLENANWTRVWKCQRDGVCPTLIQPEPEPELKPEPEHEVALRPLHCLHRLGPFAARMVLVEWLYFRLFEG